MDSFQHVYEFALLFLILALGVLGILMGLLKLGYLTLRLKALHRLQMDRVGLAEGFKAAVNAVFVLIKHL